MSWASAVAEAFNRPTSNRVRLILSLLFILFATALLMTFFQVAKGIIHPDMKLWESQLYTVIFISLVAPAIALFTLLKFDDLYQKANAEILERQRAEEALKKSERFLSTVFDSIQDGINVLDKDLNILMVNPIMEEWYAHAMPIRGKKCYSAYHGRSEPCPACPSRRAIGLGTAQSEVVPFRDDKGGVRGWLELFAFPLKSDDGNVVGVIEHVRDITDRKRAEEELSRNLAVLARSQEIARLGSWTVDFDRGRFVLSDEMYRIHGFEPGAVDPTLELAASLTYPDDRERYRAYEDALRQEGRLDGVDYRIVRPDGSVRYMHVQPDSVTRGGDGKVRTASGITQDVTERRQAEEALRGSEAKFRILFEGAGAAIFVADVATGRIIDCNGKAEELIGRPRGEIIGLHQTQLHPPHTEEVQREQFARHARGIGINNDALVQHRDGRTIPVLINAAPLNVNGREIMIGYFLDMTERKRAEEALRESEEKYRSIFEQSAVGMTHVSRDGHFIKVNQKFCDMTGYSRDELAMMSAADITYPPDIPEEKALLEQLLAGEMTTFSNEKRYIRKDGTIVWVLLTVTPIYHDGTLEYLTGVTNDITERKHAEEALRESEEKFRALADTSFGMIGVHRGSKLLYVNDQAVTITGYSKEELLSLEFWELFPPGSQELVKERAFARLQGKTEPTSYETRLLTKDGMMKWINLTAGLFDYEGEPAIIATIFDITASKDAEAALSAEKAQAELYLDLMGHDISNMHQIALGYLELARDLHPELNRGELLDRPIEVMHRSARLISNVRKLQRLRDGVSRDRDIDVCRLLADVQREFGAVPGKAIGLDLNGCESCHVRANELLHDVFANLVGNAIKHTGNHADIGIRLDVTSEPGGKYFRISVEDNGPGVADDLKPIIFSRALKGTAKAKGIGLGLYLVKSLVDSYGGQVWVEDRVKGDHTQGARFVVVLPVAEN